MRFELAGRSEERVCRNFFPVQEIAADGVHDRLLGFPGLSEMWIMAGIEDVILAFALHNRTCKHIKVLGVLGFQ